jgi:hypothetical protein
MSASAIVKVTLKVVLSQPWSDAATVKEVTQQASHEAMSSIGRLIKGHSNISLVDPPKVKIIYEERK